MESMGSHCPWLHHSCPSGPQLICKVISSPWWNWLDSMAWHFLPSTCCGSPQLPWVKVKFKLPFLRILLALGLPSAPTKSYIFKTIKSSFVILACESLLPKIFCCYPQTYFCQGPEQAMLVLDSFFLKIFIIVWVYVCAWVYLCITYAWSLWRSKGDIGSSWTGITGGYE